MKKKHLTEGPISTVLLTELMTLGSDDTGAGAVSVFIGRVRSDQEGDRVVSAIEYSAYPEMAEKEAEGIIDIVMKAFTDVRSIYIVHSVGLVKAGEASLFIMVSAGHRDQATRACRHALEMVKEKLPVWKKEIFDNATSRWSQ